MTELDPLSRALLSAASGCHEPSQADRTRVRRRLMVRLGVTAGLGALGTAATQATPAMAATAGSAVAESSLTGTLLASAKLVALGKLIGVTVAVGAAGFGGYEWATMTNAADTRAAPATSASRAPQPKPKRAATTQGANAASVESTAEDDEPHDAFGLPAPTRVGVPARVSSSAPMASHLPEDTPPTRNDVRPLASVASFPTDTPNLAAEARALARAQAALREGDAARALSLLDQQKAQFSDGALDEERAAARVFALCQMGRVQAAKAAAAEFLRRSPRSVLAERVALACTIHE